MISNAQVQYPFECQVMSACDSPEHSLGRHFVSHQNYVKEAVAVQESCPYFGLHMIRCVHERPNPVLEDIE